MYKVLLAIFVATTATACWGDITFKPMREVPEAAQSKKVRDLKLELKGEVPQTKSAKKAHASH